MIVQWLLDTIFIEILFLKRMTELSISVRTFWNQKIVSYTQTMTYLGKLRYFRISGVFVIKFDCNLFPVLYLSVWRTRTIINIHRFSDKWTFGKFHRLKKQSQTQ